MADDDKTTDDNELLTDEERAALEADEGEAIDGGASLTGEDTQDWRDAGWGGEHAPEADAPPADQQQDQSEDTAQASQGDDTAPAAKQDEGGEQRQPAPADTSDYDKKVSELRAEEQALLDKYDDGEMSREELKEQQGELQKQIDSAIEERAIAKRQIEDETAQWQDAVSKYLSEYEGLKAENVLTAFDSEVRAVTSNPALANRTFTEQLAIAHRRLASTAGDLGIKDDVPPIKGQEPAQQQQGQQSATDPRGDDLRTPPTTLARVPASDMNDAGDSKYAALQRVVDNGTPEEVEQALSQLSDEERDRFASMSV